MNSLRKSNGGIYGPADPWRSAGMYFGGDFWYLNEGMELYLLPIKDVGWVHTLIYTEFEKRLRVATEEWASGE